MYKLLTLLFVSAAPAFAAPLLIDIEPSVASAAAGGGGELLFLERRGASPFRALVAKRSSQPCITHRRAMMDIPGYMNIFSGLKQARVVEDRGKFIDYELTIDAPFDPVLPGRVEGVSDDTVVFHDLETKGKMTFRLHDDDKGCLLLYHLTHPADLHSGIVNLLHTMEPGVGDMGELVGALAVVRGYVRESDSLPMKSTALDELASRGIALSIVRRPDGGMHLNASRRVPLSMTRVTDKLRDRESWSKNADAIKKVRIKNASTLWNLGYFGGGVNLRTRHLERRRGTAVEFLETVIDGDVKSGAWSVTAQPDGEGTWLRMKLDIDFTSGSFVLRKFADGNDALRDALGVEFALNVLVDVLDDA